MRSFCVESALSFVDLQHVSDVLSYHVSWNVFLYEHHVTEKVISTWQVSNDMLLTL